jgi:hypothetical protein
MPPPFPAPHALAALPGRRPVGGDPRYSTFGTFGDPTGIGVPGIPAGATTNGPGVDNRFVSPAAPLSVYGGIRIKF